MGNSGICKECETIEVNKYQPSSLNSPARQPITVTIHRDPTVTSPSSGTIKIDLLEGNRAKITYEHG
jgi:hypothetical protein